MSEETLKETESGGDRLNKIIGEMTAALEVSSTRVDSGGRAALGVLAMLNSVKTEGNLNANSAIHLLRALAEKAERLVEELDTQLAKANIDGEGRIIDVRKEV